MIDIFSPAIRLPDYYINLLASGYKMLERSKRFLDGIKGQETSSKRNYDNVPANATIRSEPVNCGNPVIVVPMARIITHIGKIKMVILGKSILDLNMRILGRKKNQIKTVQSAHERPHYRRIRFISLAIWNKK